MFVVSFQLKLVYRTVTLFADWVRSSRYIMQKVGKCVFFLLSKPDRPNLKI